MQEIRTEAQTPDKSALPIISAESQQDPAQAAVYEQVKKIIEKRMESFRSFRERMTVEIKANLAYLVGEQNIILENGVIKPIRIRRQINPVSNLILPAIQKDLALSIQSAPKYDFFPAGTDADDRATAIAAGRIWDHLSQRFGPTAKRAESLLWYELAGIGWRKIYFNPYFRVVGVNPPPTDEQGNPNPLHNPQLPEGAPIMEGEVEIDVIPPNEIIYDFRQTDLNKLDWIIHAKRVTRAWVLDRFGPEIAQKVSGQFQKTPIGDEFELSVLDRFHSLGLTDEGQNSALPAMSPSERMELEADAYINYYEYWHKPTKSNPMGMLAAMLGDTVVAVMPYPTDAYPHNELPFVPFSPMSFQSGLPVLLPRVSQARPLQRAYNRLRALLEENIDVMGNGIWLIPRSAKVRYKTIDGGPGNIIEYDSPAGKPSREPGVPMNSQIFALMGMIKQDLESLLAFQEVTKGIAPRNIESGRGIMALQDADRAKMIPIVSALEEADQKVVYQAVMLALRHYPKGKMIQAVGSDFEWTLFEINPEEYRGRFNVRIRPLSSMPTDKEAEAVKAFQVWQSGLLGDPADPELRVWTLQQMALGNGEMILQKHAKQRNFAQKEFAAAWDVLQSAQPLDPSLPKEIIAQEIKARTFVPGVNAFDDHPVHLAVHNEWLLDHYWKIIAMNNPIAMELLQNMMLHIQQHQAVLEQQRVAAMQERIYLESAVRGTLPEQQAAQRAQASEQSAKKQTKDTKKGG